MEEVSNNVQPVENGQQETTKWYVLRVVSGKERKVKEYLDKEISRGGWGDVVKQVFLPVEKVYKVQNGKKVMRERNYYPGYVMIEIKEGKLSESQVRVFYTTPAFFDYVWAARKGLDTATAEAFANAMLKLDEANPENKAVLQLLNASKYVRAEDSSYDPLRQAARDAGLLK